MHYSENSIEGLFLSGDPASVAEVTRWVARSLSAPSFWSLRSVRADLHQEVIGRILESLRAGRFDPARNFRAYVQGIARFAAFKAIARESREYAAGDTGATPFATLAEPGRGVDDRVAAIRMARQALEASTEECRSLIGDYFLYEKRFREIATERSLPLGTVKSRLFRCLAAIRKVVGIRTSRSR